MTESSATPIDYARLASKPAVVIWYRVYCIGMAVMYAALAGAGIWLLLAEPMQGEDAITWIVLAAVSVPLAILFLVGTLVPRSKAGWIFGIVLIAIGVSGCTLVAAVPLLIFWINNRTREWFGM
jgi:hypothetical protein